MSFLSFARWFIRERHYFHRGNSYYSTLGQFVQLFILIGVWADKSPITITWKLIITLFIVYVLVTNKLGHMDYEKGVAKYEHDFTTRLNPYYFDQEKRLNEMHEMLVTLTKYVKQRRNHE